MNLRSLLSTIPFELRQSSLDCDVTDVTHDSRSVGRGSLFVAIKGSTADGHDHVGQAQSRGAVAVMVSRDVVLDRETTVVKVDNTSFALASLAKNFYGDPSSKLKITAFTGTNGKTTSTFLLRSILQELALTTAVIGTVGYFVGDKFTEAPNTTPDALLLNRILAECVSAGMEHVVMEVSSHALSLGRVEGINIDCGIFTNLTQDHLDFHSDMEDYFEAKALLFRQTSGRGAVNIDDEYGRRLHARHPSLLTFSANGVETAQNCPALVRAENPRLTIKGTTFDLLIGNARQTIQTRLVGRTNIANCLAAATAAKIIGLDDETIARGLQAARPPRGRFELIETDSDFAIAVDYAHTPDALERLLETGRELECARLLVVFGCGGDRDRQKRPIMGRIASRLADQVWITSDNPRTEDAESIIAEVATGIAKHDAKKCRRESDRRIAIRDAVSCLRAGDLLLIAGKGHEDYQIIGKKKIAFDDREIAIEAMNERIKLKE